MPRVVETASGFVHAVGLHNPGLDGFLVSELPWLAQHKVRTFVSVAGATLGEYAELARRLGRAPGLSGIEVNLADPESAQLGLFDAREPFQAARVVSTIRRELPRGLPVLAKLGCDPTRSSRLPARSPRPAPTPWCSAPRCRRCCRTAASGD